MEFRALWNMYGVRQACIDNDWFTRGDCAEYDEMLTYVESHDCTPSTLKTVAKSIANRSNHNGYDTLEDFANNIAFIILNDYCAHFIV